LFEGNTLLGTCGSLHGWSGLKTLSAKRKDSPNAFSKKRDNLDSLERAEKVGPLPFPENIDSLKRAERAVFLLDPEEGRPKASSKKRDNIDSLKRGESADPLSNPEESRSKASSKKRDNIDSLKRVERAVLLPNLGEGRSKSSSKKRATSTHISEPRVQFSCRILKRATSTYMSEPREHRLIWASRESIDSHGRAERASTHMGEPREQFSYRTQKTADLMLIRRRVIDSYKRSREQLHNRTGERAALKLLWR